MGTNPLHDPLAVLARITARKTDQMHRLAPKSPDNLPGYMMGTFHQIGYGQDVPNAFSTVGSWISLEHGVSFR
jgi:hypothetical protein